MYICLNVHKTKCDTPTVHLSVFIQLSSFQTLVHWDIVWFSVMPSVYLPDKSVSSGTHDAYVWRWCLILKPVCPWTTSFVRHSLLFIVTALFIQTSCCWGFKFKLRHSQPTFIKPLNLWSLHPQHPAEQSPFIYHLQPVFSGNSTFFRILSSLCGDRLLLSLIQTCGKEPGVVSSRQTQEANSEQIPLWQEQGKSE